LYMLSQERVYRVVVYQRQSFLGPLFRASGVKSHYIQKLLDAVIPTRSMSYQIIPSESRRLFLPPVGGGGEVASSSQTPPLVEGEVPFQNV
jgi:hypothetical protein